MKRFFSIALILLTSLLFAPQLLAAELYLDPSELRTIKNLPFELDININTQGSSVNAVEGKLIVPSSSIDQLRIIEGNSIVSFWLERPSQHITKTTDSVEVHFSGIIPGGYNGESGTIFSITGQIERNGIHFVNFSDVAVLANDGTGTEVSTNLQATKIIVNDQNESEAISLDTEIDNIPPQSFNPEIGQDSSIFKGEFFVAFSTTDKQSGILEYQVKEGPNGEWTSAQSPYRLKNQDLSQEVYIKAIDKNGNETISIANEKSHWWDDLTNLLILFIGSLVAVVFVVIILVHHKRKKELS